MSGEHGGQDHIIQYQISIAIENESIMVGTFQCPDHCYWCLAVHRFV